MQKMDSERFSNVRRENFLQLEEIDAKKSRVRPSKELIERSLPILSKMIFSQMYENCQLEWNVFETKLSKFFVHPKHPPSELKRDDISKTYHYLLSKVFSHKTIHSVNDRAFLKKVLCAALTCKNESDFTAYFKQILLESFPARTEIERDTLLWKLHNFFLKNLPLIRQLRNLFSQDLNEKQIEEWSKKVQNKFLPLLHFHPITSNLNGTTKLKIYQFLVLSQLMKSDGIIKPCILTDEHENNISKLAIKCLNPNFTGGTHPRLSATPFEIEEFSQNLKTIKNPIIIHPMNSWIEHHLISFRGSSKFEEGKLTLGDCKPEEIKKMVYEAIGQFFKDCNRSNFEFKMKGTDKIFRSAEQIITQYKNWLLKGPGNIQTEIQAQQNSAIFRHLMEAFPEYFHQNQSWPSLLAHLMSRGLLSESNSQEPLLIAKLMNIGLNAEELLQIKKLTDVEEINVLLAKRMIELLLILSQASFSTPTIEVHKLINSDYHEIKLAFSVTRRVFEFSQNLSSFILKAHFDIYTTGEDLKDLGINDWTDSSRKLISILSIMQIENLDSKGSNTSLEPISEIFFNWNCPESLILHLSEKHNIQGTVFSMKKIAQLANPHNASEPSEKNARTIKNLAQKLNSLFQVCQSLNQCNNTGITFEITQEKEYFANRLFCEKKLENSGDFVELESIWKQNAVSPFPRKKYLTPYKSWDEVDKIIIGLNRLLGEAFEIHRLISQLSIETLDENTSAFYRTLNLLNQCVKEALNSQIKNVLQRLEDKTEGVIVRYIQKLSSDIILTIGNLYSHYHHKLLTQTPPQTIPYVSIRSIKNLTFLGNFQNYENIREGLQSAHVKDRVVVIPQELLQSFEELKKIKRSLSKDDIKQILHDQKAGLRTPLLATILPSQKGRIVWQPAVNPSQFSNSGNYLVHPNDTQDLLTNFKVQIDKRKSHLAVSCSVINNESKMLQYISAVTEAWDVSELAKKNKPFRLTMHQYNSTTTEQKIIDEQNNYSRKIESNLKRDELSPIIAHINLGLNFATSLPYEDKNSYLQNLEGLAALALWAIEDLKKIDIERKVPEVEWEKLFLLSNEISTLRHKLNLSKNLLSLAQSENEVLSKEMLKNQNLLREELRNFVRLAYNRSSQISARESLPSTCIFQALKAENTLRVLTYVLAVQMDCLSELGLGKVSRVTEMELNLILDMHLGCITSMNCKSGLDSTGLVRSCWDALRTMWIHFSNAPELQKFDHSIREQFAYRELLEMVLTQDRESLSIDKIWREQTKKYDFKLLSHENVNTPYDPWLSGPRKPWRINLRKFSQKQLIALDYQNLILQNMLNVALVITMESRGAPGLKYGQDGGIIGNLFSNDHPLSRIPMFLKTANDEVIQLYELKDDNLKRHLTPAGREILLGFSKYENH